MSNEDESRVNRVTSGSLFEAEIGYCRAIASGGWIFVSGTTGYDCDTMVMPDDVVAQCRNALGTIERALADLGAGMRDVVRVRYIVPNPGDWPLCWPVTRAVFGAHPPAATMISAGLQLPEMKIEIEAQALHPLDAGQPMRHMSPRSSGAET
ncbi:RidA family protein [Palleronia sp. LCG004]|uniref:RidA family protein n=1 Tax=Palleronia sp. LCG004 TaxID=3079304 RepID=UPI0029424474|nr:RidA family protein [Palleronia sp. LCG004]WOI55282.1 RidA family protein [Palleronia sp. LCG004]